MQNKGPGMDRGQSNHYEYLHLINAARRYLFPPVSTPAGFCFLGAIASFLGGSASAARRKLNFFRALSPNVDNRPANG
jgi:hypothetical protein